MRSTSERRRVSAYVNFIFTHDDLRWIIPRHADALWDVYGPMYRELAKSLTQSYNSTMLKLGADAIKVTAYSIGQRSKHCQRYREVCRRFRRLPELYWVKTISPWYEHDSMPYVFIRGRVIFWPGLDQLISICAELESPDLSELSSA